VDAIRLDEGWRSVVGRAVSLSQHALQMVNTAKHAASVHTRPRDLGIASGVGATNVTIGVWPTQAIWRRNPD
jgi:hypothetical protein